MLGKSTRPCQGPKPECSVPPTSNFARYNHWLQNRQDTQVVLSEVVEQICNITGMKFQRPYTLLLPKLTGLVVGLVRQQQQKQFPQMTVGNFYSHNTPTATQLHTTAR